MLALGPFLVACAVLAVGGVTKALDPEPTRALLRALALPAPAWAPASLGTAEIGLAVAAAATGWRGAAAVAVAYLGFAAVTARLATRPGATACGCFGRLSAPPSRLHVAADLGLAAAAGAAAVDRIPGLGQALAGQPGAGVPLLLAVAVGCLLVVTATTALPLALAAGGARS